MQKLTFFFGVFLLLLVAGCNPSAQNQAPATADAGTTGPTVGQSGVKDDVSTPNVVQIAVGSADHTTLVTAVKAASLVDVLSNAGPFTVFALSNILEYHVYVGVIKTETMRDGQILGQVNGKNITLSVKDGKYMINDKATIVASVPASNGIIHVIDEVLLPPQ